MQMVRGISSGARVFEYLALEPTIPQSGGGRIPYNSLMGRVDFMNIWFRLIIFALFNTDDFTLCSPFKRGKRVTCQSKG